MKKQIVLIILLLAFFVPSTASEGCESSTATDTEAPTAIQQQQVINVTAAEAFDLIKANMDNPDFIIIDVRTLGEYDAGHIENAVLVNYNSPGFREEINEFEKDKIYLVYCRTGNRSSSAIAIMKELGFSFIYHMKDGITEWLAEGLPVIQ